MPLPPGFKPIDLNEAPDAFSAGGNLPPGFRPLSPEELGVATMEPPADQQPFGGQPEPIAPWADENNILTFDPQLYADESTAAQVPTTHDIAKTLGTAGYSAQLLENRIKAAELEHGQMLPDRLEDEAGLLDAYNSETDKAKKTQIATELGVARHFNEVRKAELARRVAEMKQLGMTPQEYLAKEIYDYGQKNADPGTQIADLVMGNPVARGASSGVSGLGRMTKNLKDRIVQVGDSAIAAATGSQEMWDSADSAAASADARNREASIQQATDEFLDTKSVLPKWAANSLRQGTDSLVQSVAVGGGSGQLFRSGVGALIGYYSAQQADQSYTQAIDNGLSKSDAAKYAILNGSLEGVMTALFSKLGKSAEEMFAKPEWTGISDFLKGLGLELSEETSIAMAQQASNYLFEGMANIDTEHPIKGLSKDLLSAAAQVIGPTIVSMGAMGGATKLSQFMTSPSKETAKAAGIPESMAATDEEAKVLADKAHAMALYLESIRQERNPQPSDPQTQQEYDQLYGPQQTQNVGQPEAAPTNGASPGGQVEPSPEVGGPAVPPGGPGSESLPAPAQPANEIEPPSPVEQIGPPEIGQPVEPTGQPTGQPAPPAGPVLTPSPQVSDAIQTAETRAQDAISKLNNQNQPQAQQQPQAQPKNPRRKVRTREEVVENIRQKVAAAHNLPPEQARAVADANIALLENTAKKRGMTLEEYVSERMNPIESETTSEEWDKKHPRKKKGVAVLDKSLTQEGDEPKSQWYMKSTRLVNEKMGPKATAQQVLSMLQKNGVKDEEIEWSGLKELLGNGSSTVTKQQVLDAIQGGVQVEEKVKSGDPKAQIINQAYETIEANGYKVDSADFFGVELSKDGEPITIEDDAVWKSLPVDVQRAVVSLQDNWESIEQPEGEAKFSQWQLPGGKNYRELLLTMPVNSNDLEADPDAPGAFRRSGAYYSHHFDEPNILAHIRFNERTDADGKKVLFIEEVQSDWHQTGRKKGYNTKNVLPKGWRIQEFPANRYDHREFVIYDDTGEPIANGRTREAALRRLGEHGVPNAPFKKTWPMLAMKRAIQWASENGFDRIAWTTGEQQAERYDLSKQVDRIDTDRHNGTTDITVIKGSDIVLKREGVSDQELADLIGKELAEKVVNQKTRLGIYTGLDLKVGGEGMKAFYDQMLPSEVNKFIKKFGSKVGKLEQNVGYMEQKPFLADFEEIKGSHVFDITQAMRESALQEGQPLFQKVEGYTSGVDPETMARKRRGQIAVSEKTGRSTITLFENAQDASTLFHELSHDYLASLMLSNDPQDQADLKTIEREIGVKDGMWTRDDHEHWARANERYMHEGKFKSEALRKVLSKFRDWFRKIYKTIRNSKIDVKISPKLREVLDRIYMTPEEIAAYYSEKQAAAEEKKRRSALPSHIKRLTKLFDNNEGSIHRDDYEYLKSLDEDTANKLLDYAESEVASGEKNGFIKSLIDQIDTLIPRKERDALRQKLNRLAANGNEDRADVDQLVDVLTRFNDHLGTNSHPLVMAEADSLGNGDLDHGLRELLKLSNKKIKDRHGWVDIGMAISDAVDQFKDSLDRSVDTGQPAAESRPAGFNFEDGGEYRAPEPEEEFTLKNDPERKVAGKFDDSINSQQKGFLNDDLEGQHNLFDEEGDISFNPGEFSFRKGDQSNSAGSQPFGEKSANVAGAMLGKLRGIKVPELIQLAKDILGGKLPIVKKMSEGKLGAFRSKEGSRTSMEILLNPNLAKNENELAATIAHEIGHAVDFLPDATLKRGNILGRIASLRGYLDQFMAKHPGAEGPLTDEDLKELRAKAKDSTMELFEEEVDEIIRHETPVTPKDILNIWNSVGVGENTPELTDYIKKLSDAQKKDIVMQAIKGQVPEELKKFASVVEERTGKKVKRTTVRANGRSTEEVYRQLIEDEIRRRQLLDAKVIRKELIDLTKWWSGDYGDFPSPYKSYRESSRELYAEALSVFLNSPGELEQRAPEFWRGFTEYLGEKPEVLQEYLKIQEMLNGTPEQLAADRSERIRGMFKRGDEAIRAAYNAREAARQSTTESLRQHFEQKLLGAAAPIRRRMKLARERGEEFNDETNAYYILDELSTIDAPVHNMLRRIEEEVFQPALEQGFSRGDIDEYLFLHRVVNERNEIINPLGFTRTESQNQLDQMKKDMGAEKFQRLQGAMSHWHDIIFEAAESAVDAGVYNRELFEKTIRPNKDNYATFAVIHYLEHNAHIPAKIFQQIGTLSEVASPTDATHLKAVTLHRLIALNKAKTAVRDFLQKSYPHEIKRIEIPPGKSEPSIPPKHGMEHMLVLEDGKMTAYEIPEIIAKSFMRHDIGSISRAMRFVQSAIYRVFHPLYVTFSPAFAVANVPRDFKRTQINLMTIGRQLEAQQFDALKKKYLADGRKETEATKLAKEAAKDTRITLRDVLKAYWDSVGTAWKRAAGVDDKIIKQMMDDHILDIPFASVDTSAIEEAGATEHLFQRYGIREAKPGAFATRVRNATPAIARKILSSLGGMVEGAGIFGETLSKVAAYKLLQKKGITGKRRSFIVRKYTGTPDYKQRGLWTDGTNALWMYQKVRLNGLQWDLDLATSGSGKTAAAFWWQRAVWNIAPTTAKKAMAYGAFGSAVSALMAAIPQHFKDNYDVIPLGWVGGDDDDEEEDSENKGKALYLTIPMDDTGRLISALWSNAMDASAELAGYDVRPGGAAEAGQEALEQIYGSTVGTFNPLIDISSKWLQFGMGTNPRDTHYQTEVVPQTEWKAGGSAAVKPMLTWTANKFGVISSLAHSITGPTLGNPFESDSETPVETAIRSIPGLSSVLRVSDRGISERQWADVEAADAERARFKLGLPKEATRNVKALYVLQRRIDKLPYKEQVSQDYLRQWYSKSYLPLTRKMQEPGADVEALKKELKDQSSDIKATHIGYVAQDYAKAAVLGLGHPDASRAPKRYKYAKSAEYQAAYDEWKASYDNDLQVWNDRSEHADRWLKENENDPAVRAAIKEAVKPTKIPIKGGDQRWVNQRRKIWQQWRKKSLEWD